jgi:hypothetical protein
VSVTFWALDQRSRATIDCSIRGIHVLNFFLQLLIGETGLIAQQSPHRVARQRQSLNAMLQIAHMLLGRVGPAAGFVRLANRAEIVEQ